MGIKTFLKGTLSLVVLMMLSVHLLAQTQVSGIVYEADGKTPFTGVSVSIKGTTKGTSTDLDGKYTLSAKPTDILIYQFLGYETQEIAVGKQAKINVIMKEAAQNLEGIVVTALGMKREEKALGYATSKVANEDLTNVVSNNWLNAMSGKVAGLNLDGAATGPGGSVRVTLRGESSLNLSNGSALFVVDGVPVNSSMTSSNNGGAAYNTTDAPVDYGNGAADINPEDVESVTVLKGPAATALYGSRAGNGAIIITTKSGKKDKGLGITLSSSVSFEKAGYWPEFQKEYGTGLTSQKYYSFYGPGSDSGGLVATYPDGTAVSRNHSRYAFGPKYEGQYFYQYQSRNWETNEYTPLLWEYADGWYKGMFETGVTFNNTLSIESNNGEGRSIRLSITDFRQDWILPNTPQTRQTISFSANQDVNKHIKLSSKINYFRRDSDNIPTTGYGTASPMYEIAWNPVTTDVKWYYDEYIKGRINGGADKTNLNYENDNPYMSLYEQVNTLDRDRIYGNIVMDIEFAKNLTLMLRTGLDNNREFRTQRKPYLSTGSLQGFYREQTIAELEMNHDFLLKYDKEFGKFNANLSLGGNSMHWEYYSNQSTADKLAVEGQYMLANSVDPLTVYVNKKEKAVNSLYGMLQLSYNNYLFLDITGRNDWSSTLPKGNNSYFYPAFSLSAVITEMTDIKKRLPWLDMLKVRASWANVGNDTDPYTVDQYYSNTDFTGGVVLPGSVSNENLKPENVESTEMGIEMKMFKNRISFDATYYVANSTNQIISVPTDYITGGSSRVINAGHIRNQGLELAARFQPVKNKKFRWDINMNWSTNKNKVLELAPGVDSWIISTGPRGYVKATVGGSLGDLYGTGLVKAPKGATVTIDGKSVDVSGWDIVDKTNGEPIKSSEYKLIGNVQPKWKAGMTHSISYKNFKLDMAFSAQWKGMAYSSTNFLLSYQGKLTNSLYGRYDGLVHKGVNVATVNGETVYTMNNTITTDVVNYYRNIIWHRDNMEYNTFSTTFLKFKEARLTYDMPKKLVSKIKGIQGVSVGVFATNIFCITHFPQYDPEIATMNGSLITKGFETLAYPMTRTYGANIKLQF